MANTKITSKVIADDAILTANIADDQVTADKLANAINTSIAAKLPLAGGTLTGDIAHAGNFTLDVEGVIKFDANGAEIQIKDGGTEIGAINMASSNLNIDAKVADKDIVFRGIDGSSDVTALTLDMSAAGAATFNNGVVANASGGVSTLGANGHVTSKQSLDTATAGGRFIGESNRGHLGEIAIEQTANSTDGGYIRFATSASGSTSSTTHMTINNAGNVGIGATPKVTEAGWTNLSVGGMGALINSTSANAGGRTQLSNNIYVDESGNYSYISTDEASLYKQINGIHSWHNAASGSADAHITLSERMRIDSSGKVGIGTAVAPAQKLTVTGASGANVGGLTNGILALTTGTGVIADTRLLFGIVDDNYAWIQPADYGVAYRNLSLCPNGGNLLVGATSGSAHTISKSTANGGMLEIINSSTTAPSGAAFKFSHQNPNDGTSTFFTTADSSAYRGGWLSNGGVQNYQANNSNLSDRREKTNFNPAKSYLDIICGIPVQTFNYIDQNMEDDDSPSLGVVAQDVQATAPELVVESNWGTKDVPKMRLSIYQTDFQYALMKCIQEQQTIIEDLKARIETLES